MTHTTFRDRHHSDDWLKEADDFCADAPLVKGGQGKSASNVIHSAALCGVVAGLALAGAIFLVVKVVLK